MRHAGDLRCQARQQDIIDIGHFDQPHMRLAGDLDPHLKWLVDENFGDIVALQPWQKRLEIRPKIDAVEGNDAVVGCRGHVYCPTAKSRSRAAKTWIGAPGATLIVGGILTSFDKASMATF